MLRSPRHPKGCSRLLTGKSRRILIPALCFLSNPLFGNPFSTPIIMSTTDNVIKTSANTQRILLSGGPTDNAMNGSFLYVYGNSYDGPQAGALHIGTTANSTYYLYTANAIRYQVNGSGNHGFSGKIGVGHNDPLYDLDVRTDGVVNIRGTNGWLYVDNIANNSNASGGIVKFNSGLGIAGKATIGTTTPSNYAMDVQSATNYTQLRVRANLPGGEPLIKLSGGYNGGNGSELWQNSTGKVYLNVNSGRHGIVIDGDGKVGIGSEFPSAELEVKDLGTDPNETAEIHLRGGGSGGGVLRFYRGSTEQGSIRSDLGSGDIIFEGGAGPNERMRIKSDGDVKILGKIEVAGVRTATWTVAPDYVFEKGYKLASLEEVDAFVRKNKHLPEVPSAKEFADKGMDLAEMNFTLLKKVEELTLHAIEQNRQVRTQAEHARMLEQEIRDLKQTIAGLANSMHGKKGNP